jgi:nitrite reductase/ring-hydroxylating ferredoxin subunit
MSQTKTDLSGPDLAKGVAVSKVADGAMLLGHAHGKAALLARRGDELFAIGATCTHYGAPLADRMLVDYTVRCPWHHACFSLRSGEVLRAPALDPIACWRVEQHDGIASVREDLAPVHAVAPAAPAAPNAIVIIGGGGAGNAAAEMLRQKGYAGGITMLSADAASPYDRPNLSKGDLAGSGAATVTPPRSAEFYRQQRIDLRVNVWVARIDVAAKHVELADGSHHHYDAPLIATGAHPVRLDLPGADLPHVHYLRTRADCDGLIAGAKSAKRAVVVGASFIGLEVTSSLRARGLEVQVSGSMPSRWKRCSAPRSAASSAGCTSSTA